MDSRTQLEAIVDYVHQYCEKNGIARLPEICLPTLENVIVCDTVKYGCGKNQELRTAIGIYDDPDHQYQGNADVPIGTANTLILGSSQYGKTNLLEVFIRTFAETYTPSEVNLYIIDFASMVLKNFEKLVHVGGVVCPADDEKLKNLFKYLSDQMAFRREKLLSAGVSSFLSYREAGFTDLPQIILLIDNMTVLKELYLQDNDVLLALSREGNSVGISVIMANAQTSGLGYKYLANFATRISMFCNEAGEYSTLFGSCRIRPDEVPGRCLLEIEKTLYECQTFLAFEGDREIERVQQMQKFVETVNSRHQGSRAVPIPEIPDILTEQYIFDNFAAALNQSKQVLGLSYDTVAPQYMDAGKVNMLALSGAEGSGMSNFIYYFVHSLRKQSGQADVFIFDDYRKKLASLCTDPEHCFYHTGADQCEETLLYLDQTMQDRYQKLIAGDEIPEDWKILILNNEDVYAQISNDKALFPMLKNLVSRYKMLHVFVLFGAIPNAQVSFGSPEAYKLIKENRQILFFDNLENCKLVDVPLATIRNNCKKIDSGDAFYLSGNDCFRIRTPLSMKG